MNFKKKLIPIGIFLAFLAIDTRAQDFGLSFSYFIPKNGYFSTPISPFSIRGLGVDFNRFVGVQTGASLYRMSGLNLKDLPFESMDPLVGPNFTLFIPVELVLQFQGNAAEFNIKGGGFFFYGLGQKINYGNFDRALRSYEGWDVANAEVDFENKPGFGYMVGTEFMFYVTNQIGVSLEANYLVGESKFPLTGSYTGGNTSIETKALDYPDSKIDFTGVEFSIGVFYSTGQRSGSRSRRR